MKPETTPLPLTPLDAAQGLDGCPANLVNGFGMLPGGLCEAGANGFSQWWAQMPAGGALTFRLEEALPLGRLEVWNYCRTAADGTNYAPCGLRAVQVFHSLDGSHWTELRGRGWPYVLAQAGGAGAAAASNLESGGAIDFGGAAAQYIKLAWNGVPGEGNHDGGNRFDHRFGLAKLRLFEGAGLYARPAPAWTALLARRSGWAGADGVFSMPFSGPDNLPNPSRTLLMFGDTFVGGVQPGGSRRAAGTAIVNNSCCVLEDGTADPAKARFQWGKDGAGSPRALVQPGPAALGPAALGPAAENAFFWFQDSLIFENRYYAFPLLVREDLSGPEGYQFSVEGLAFLSAPIRGGEVQWAETAQSLCPLTGPDGLVFGCAVFQNTAGAGAPAPDGFLYLYGTKPRGLARDLYVCRIPQARFPSWDAAEFYDGAGWQHELQAAAPLCENVSCELSVSPYFGRLYQGKYLLVFTEYTNSPAVSCRVGDSPVGPFSEIMPLYRCPEPEKGFGIYTYNAKAHPHLSAPERLLVSYNVNTCSLGANEEDAAIYSPRFLELRETPGAE